MKKLFRIVLSMLLVLVLSFSLYPAALAEEGQTEGEDSLIDEEALNQWADALLQTNNLVSDWKDVSIGFCYTATGDCWFYNADVFMYSASLYKVPVNMLMAELEVAGEVDQDTVIQGNTLQYLQSSSLVNSNNYSGHALVDYLGGTYNGKCSDMAIPYTQLPESYFVEDFYQTSYYSARFMTQVMITLYEGGEERFPHVNEYLLQAQPDEYLNRTLKDKYPVAQKYGAFTEGNGNDNNHVAAIVYTPTPIIVVVMTRNVAGYQQFMAEIGAYLADYSLKLDEKLAERQAQAPETPAPTETQAPDETPVQTPEQTEPGTETAAPQPEGAAAETEPETDTEPEAPQEPKAPQDPSEKRIQVFILSVLAGAGVLMLFVFIDSIRRKRLSLMRDDEEED